MTINRTRFNETERRDVSKADFMDALAQILASDHPNRRKAENREPTKAEPETRWRLDRRSKELPI